MYFVRTPFFIKKLAPNIIWELPNTSNSIYLTFDDGPHPEITPWILDQLKKFQAKATFFCLGKNIEKHPAIVQQMLLDGHTIANHGYDHLNGWKIKDDVYFQDFLKTQQMLLPFNEKKTTLFRPAYGKIKPSQMALLQKATPNDLKIINWSLMPGDFDTAIHSISCFRNLQRVQQGDIIVLHDNEKSWKHIAFCLPLFLEFCKTKQIQLKTIPN